MSLGLQIGESELSNVAGLHGCVLDEDITEDLDKGLAIGSWQL